MNKMSYKISAKNRKLKRTILNIISILKFESLNIETPKKIVLFWVILAITALFLNWTEAVEQRHVWNVFKNFLWITWYLLILINIKIIFIIFSQRMKDFVKMFFNFQAKDWVMVIFLWAFGLFLAINSIFIIENFSYFTTGILVWKWAVLSIVWYIFTLIGGILMLKSRTKTWIYIDSDDENLWLENNIDNESEKNNMKLPF